MRTILFLLEKEFKQVFRDPILLRLMFMMPVVQLIILPFAVDYEVKNINLSVVDHDRSPYSNQLIHKISASKYFKLVSYDNSYQEAMQKIARDEADIILEIPAGFEEDLVRESEVKIFQATNAVNGAKANIGSGYLQQIIARYNNEIRMKWIQMPRSPDLPLIHTTHSYWYNKKMDYKTFMVPGILALLITIIGGLLSSLNIVREKEIGTIEQINVTPVKKYEFILAKLIPFWIIGQLVLIIGLLISWLGYGIPIKGSIGVLFLFTSLYLLAIMGFGLLISTYANTQQQSMLISYFFVMIFILMGGLLTPIESMPDWAQKITWFNPVRYIIEVIRMIILKGSGISSIAPHLAIVGAFAIVLNTWAILNYKKRN